ncbi:MAG: glycosyltransferase family 4 protein [Actinomycetaceae bacterium]
MRVLVCPHRMGMGGSQLHAVELAAAVRRHGHEPVVYAPPGVLTDLVRDAGLTWVPAPHERTRRAWSRGLADVARLWDVELVHAYEWRPSVQAAFGSGRRLPLLMSVMAMEVPDLLPTHVPLVVGTPELRDQMRARGRTAHLLEPAVDMGRPLTVDAGRARAGWGIADGELVVGVVSMLTTDLEKLQGVLEAIRVVDRLADRLPISLLIAGDGEGRAAVEARARAVNARHGRTVVRPVGFLADAGPAYAASDVVLGMGSSAIKGMAHGRPLVVQGEAGFWSLVDGTTVDGFRSAGWFGRGGAGARDLTAALRALAGSPDLRRRLGALGREAVEERYDLDRGAEALAEIYRVTAAHAVPRSARVRSLARSAAAGARYYADTRLGSVLTREQRAREGAHA